MIGVCCGQNKFVAHPIKPRGTQITLVVYIYTNIFIYVVEFPFLTDLIFSLVKREQSFNGHMH